MDNGLSGEQFGRLKLCLLGPFHLEMDGSQIHISGPARQVLAFLALEDDAIVHRAKIASSIWPEAPAKTARFYLRRVLMEIKATPAASLVVIQREAIQLNLDIVDCPLITIRQKLHKPRHRVDLSEQERKTMVLPLLEGVDSPWLEMAREVLGRDLGHCLLNASHYLLANRLGKPAIELLELAVAIQPYWEQLWRALFRSYAFEGRQTEIAESYKVMRRRFAQDLDLAPTAETASLVQTLVDPPQPRSGSQKAGQLPLSGDPFIGREREVEAINTLLTEGPVSLVGIGGIGKTRLASYIAARRGGAYWFSVGYGTSNSLRAMVAGEFRTQDNELAIFERLRSVKALFVVDNAESTMRSDRSFLEALVASCPNISLLITSREPLGIRPEQTFNLSPVSLPSEQPCGKSASFQVFSAYIPPQIKRFGAREIADVEQICELLGGVPLALKLAALKLRALPLNRVLAGIREDVRLVDGGRSDSPSSMKAAFEWSFSRLTQEAQLLFTRLSPLEGLWEDGLACSLAGGSSGSAAAALEELVVAGLVIRIGDYAYRSVNPLRQYAMVKLSADDDSSRKVYARLIEYYEGITAGICDGTLEPRPAFAPGIRFVADLLTGRLERRESHRIAMSAEALVRIWDRSAEYTVGAAWLDNFLVHVKEISSSERANLFLARARFATELYDLEGSVKFIREGIRLVRENAGPQELESALRLQLAEAYCNQGSLSNAERELGEALRLADLTGSQVARGRILQRQSYVASERREFVAAHALLGEALQIFLAAGDSERFLSARETLAATLLNENRLDECEDVLKDCDKRRIKAGEDQFRHWLLNSLAEIANRRGEFAAAIAYTDEALSILGALGLGQTSIYSLQLQAHAYAGLGKDALAIELLEEVLSMAESAGMDAARALNLSRMVRIYERKGDLITAGAYRAQLETLVVQVRLDGDWPNAAMNSLPDS